MALDPPPGPGGPPTVPPPDGGAPAWWEDGEGWDGGDAWGPFPLRRRSRVLRVVGIGVAAALIMASVGGALEVVLSGPSGVSLTVHVDSVTALSSGGGGPSSEVRATTESVRVTFTVVNHGATTVTPLCRITMVRRGRVLGTFAVVGEGPLAGQAAAPIPAVVPVGGPVRGRGLATADVVCH